MENNAHVIDAGHDFHVVNQWLIYMGFSTSN